LHTESPATTTFSMGWSSWGPVGAGGLRPRHAKVLVPQSRHAAEAATKTTTCRKRGTEGNHRSEVILASLHYAYVNYRIPPNYRMPSAQPSCPASIEDEISAPHFRMGLLPVRILKCATRFFSWRWGADAALTVSAELLHGKYRAGLRQRFGARPAALAGRGEKLAIWLHAVSWARCSLERGSYCAVRQKVPRPLA